MQKIKIGVVAMAIMVSTCTIGATPSSNRTEHVIAFRPIFDSLWGEGAMWIMGPPGQLQLLAPGVHLNLDIKKLNYYDRDGDAMDLSATNRTINWTVGGIVVQRGSTQGLVSPHIFEVPNTPGLPISVDVTPTSVEGTFPLSGRTMSLYNFNAIGIRGGDGDLGNLIPHIRPSITKIDMSMQGEREVLPGNVITARYTFNTNNGSAMKHVDFQWGHLGSTRVLSDPQRNSNPNSSVLNYRIKSEDIGKFIELTIRPTNLDNAVGLPFTNVFVARVLDSTPESVEITYDDKATEESSGKDFIGHPLVGVSQLRAVVTPKNKTVNPREQNYHYDWRVGGQLAASASGVGRSTFTGNPERHQGRAVTVTVRLAH